MSKYWLGVIIGILVSSLIFLAVIRMVAPKMMFNTAVSPHSVEKTVELIEQTANEKGWSIPKVYNLQATMAKHEYEVRPVMVISLCKPEHAYRILKENEERVVSTMMPCRIAVYQGNDGKTYISSMNAGLISGMLGGLVKEVMTDAGRENDEIIEKVLAL